MTAPRRLLALVLAVAFWALGLGAAIFSAETPSGSIVGRVVEKDGGPLAGARVILHGESSGKTRTVRTTEDGTFRADNLPVDTYRVLARKRGFDAQWIEPEVELEENQERKGTDFALMPREPSVHFAHYQPVFLPGERLRIGTRGSLVERLDVALYRLDPDAILAGRGHLGELVEWESRVTGSAALAALPPNVPDRAVTPIATWSAGIPESAADEDDWFYRPLEVAPQPEGMYLLTIRAQDGDATLRDAYWFNLTRLALVTKRARDQVLVFATDFTTKLPLARAEIRAFWGPRVVARGRTDAGGLWQARLPESGSPLTVVGRSGDSFAHLLAYHGTSTRLSVYAYTDRPIYRPGHLVRFKGIVRDLRHAEPRLVAVRTVRVKVRDPDGGEVFERSLPVSGLGTYHGDFVLPEDGRTGEYSLIAEIDDNRYDQSFKVEAYRKPEFKVEVRPAGPRVVGGETMQVGVDATYYFGATVAGVKVRYSVFKRPEYPGWSEEDAFYGGYGGHETPYGGEVVLEGDALTDDAGHLALAVPTAKIAPADAHDRTYDQRYVVEVESQDQSRRLVKAGASFLVTRGRFDLEAETSTYLVQSGQPVRVAITARDYDGKPVRTRVDVQLDRAIYVPPEASEEYGTTTYEPAGRQTVETDENGLATAEVRAPGPGSYTVRLEAADDRQNRIGAQAWFWASSEQTEPTEAYGSLGVTFDRKTYQVGDTARVLVTAPVPDLTLLISIEGTSIHEARTLRLRGSSARLDIPVVRAYQPNVWIDVTAVNGRELLSSGRSLNVLPTERFVTVEIEPDKTQYLPGEGARFRLKAVSAAGRPVEGAEISLGVVDEAIYALAPDLTPDIRRFFLGPRSSDVSTAHSFATDYSGGPAKDLGEVRIRKNFQDTAAWFPALRTGADGTALADFVMPDNLTTWVCTARAVTASTQVGSAIRNVLATKDLLVRLQTPRFFTQGDALGLAAITHNYTPADQRVRIALDPGSLTLIGERTRSAMIPKGGADRQDFSVRVETAGTASVQVVAGNRAANDGMALDVPIKPHGLPVARTWAGEVRPEAAIDFDVPVVVIPETVRFAVDVSPSPWVALLAGISYLQRYPYWCTEQTTSRLVPFALVGLALPADSPLRPVLAIDLALATRTLLGLQHSQGWGWFEGGDTEVETTAYALWGLAHARAADSDVPAERVRRGVDYLAGALPKLTRDTPRRYAMEQGTGPDTRAVGLWGLAYGMAARYAAERAGGPAEDRPDLTFAAPLRPRTSAAGTWLRRVEAARADEIDRLWRDRAGLTTYGWAIFAEALAISRHPLADKALGELEARAQESETMVHWEAGGKAFTWSDNDVEATSHALLAFLARDSRHRLVLKAERYLEMNRRHDRWMSTKDTAAALAAIAGVVRSQATSYANRSRPEPGTAGTAGALFRDPASLDGNSGTAGRSGAPYLATLTLDGSAVATATADPGPAGVPARFVVDPARLGPGRHKAVLTIDRPDAGPMWSAELRYAERREDIAAEPGKILAVSRSYFAIPAALQAESRVNSVSWLFSEKIFPRLVPVSGRTQVGDRLVVRTRVSAKQLVRYAVVEDPLPSGAEVLVDESGPSTWWSHRDILDDKVVFFADALPPGKEHDFYYVIRPELPGQLHVLPPVVEAMYAPDVRAHGAETRLEVAE